MHFNPLIHVLVIPLSAVTDVLTYVMSCHRPVLGGPVAAIFDLCCLLITHDFSICF